MDPKDLMKKETNALTSYVQALGKRESMWEAAKTLIKQGDASVPALVEGLRDSDHNVRSISAVVLGELGLVASQAVPELIQLLKDGNQEARMSAALSLMRIGPAAEEALEQCLKNEDKEVQFWAAWALVMNNPTKLHALPILQEGWNNSNDKYKHLAAAEALFKAMNRKIDESKE